MKTYRMCVVLEDEETTVDVDATMYVQGNYVDVIRVRNEDGKDITDFINDMCDESVYEIITENIKDDEAAVASK